MADIKTVSGPWRVCSVERALALVQCSGLDAAARCTTRQGTWVEVMVAVWTYLVGVRM